MQPANFKISPLPLRSFENMLLAWHFRMYLFEGLKFAVFALSISDEDKACERTPYRSKWFAHLASRSLSWTSWFSQQWNRPRHWAPWSPWWYHPCKIYLNLWTLFVETDRRRANLRVKVRVLPSGITQPSVACKLSSNYRKRWKSYSGSLTVTC
jgi:hypothetical protein